jgi:glycosyltransferase involved in cell wall biosynthesis
MASGAAPRVSQICGREPRVTVVMAVYNGERYLDEALHSLFAQTFNDYELLVVDDASSDLTPKILASYEDRRLRVLRNGRNLGLTASLNRALREARGTYVARQDVDDLSDSTRLERQVAFLDEHNHVALLGTAYRRIDEEGRATGDRRVPQDENSIRWRLLFMNAFSHSTVMFRRGVLSEVGLYDESFRYAQDYELWSRIARRHAVAALPDVLVSYRETPSSMTSTYEGAGNEIKRIAADNVDSLIPAMSRRFDRDAAWRLLFGDIRNLELKQAVAVAVPINALASAFARRYRLSRRHAIAHHARVLATIVRRSARMTARGATQSLTRLTSRRVRIR